MKVSEVFHYAAGPAPFGGEVRGPAPDHGTYGSYVTFRDPDGNGWLLQEVTTRFPERGGCHDVRVGVRPVAGAAAREARPREALPSHRVAPPGLEPKAGFWAQPGLS